MQKELLVVPQSDFSLRNSLHLDVKNSDLVHSVEGQFSLTEEGWGKIETYYEALVQKNRGNLPQALAEIGSLPYIWEVQGQKQAEAILSDALVHKIKYEMRQRYLATKKYQINRVTDANIQNYCLKPEVCKKIWDDVQKSQKKELGKTKEKKHWRRTLLAAALTVVVGVCGTLGVLAWKNKELISALLDNKPGEVLLGVDYKGKDGRMLPDGVEDAWVAPDKLDDFMHDHNLLGMWVKNNGKWIEMRANEPKNIEVKPEEVAHFPSEFSERMHFLFDDVIKAQYKIRGQKWENNYELQSLTYYEKLTPDLIEEIKNSGDLVIMYNALDRSYQGPKSHRSDGPMLMIMNPSAIKIIGIDRSTLLARGLDEGGFGDTVNVQTYIPDGYKDTHPILGADSAMENMCNAITIATGIPIDACIGSSYEGYAEILDQLIPPEGIQLHFEDGFVLANPKSPLRRKLGGNGIYNPDKYPEAYYFTTADILDLIRWRKVIIIDSNPKNDDDKDQLLKQRSDYDRIQGAIEIVRMILEKRVVKDGVSLKSLILNTNRILDHSQNIWTNNPGLFDPMVEKLNHSDVSQADLIEFMGQLFLNQEFISFTQTPAPLTNGMYQNADIIEAVTQELVEKDSEYRVLVGVRSENTHLTTPFAPVLMDENGKIVGLDWARLRVGVDYDLALREQAELDRLEDFYRLWRVIMSKYSEFPMLNHSN